MTTPGVTQSSGPKRLPASQWFIRAVHAYVAALTAPDAVGPMFAVDMRLRPSGNKGPVAVSLPAFEHYHGADNGAWTWERMALTRARVVAGPPKLRARVEGAIRAAHRQCRPALAHPRRRRRHARAPAARVAAGWPVGCQAAAAAVEVEFIAQPCNSCMPRLCPKSATRPSAAR